MRPSSTLLGCVVVVTADRRRREIALALNRRGATVVHAPSLTTVPHLDDEGLVLSTREVVANPPDIVVATTGIGFRGWIEAADAAGLLDDLTPVLQRARLIARGPKARGAIQQAGFEAEWVAVSETAAEVRDHLLAEDLAGRVITVQHHGNGSDGLDEAFQDAGANVRSVVVYGWGPPPDPASHRDWVLRTADGEVDTVLFTSAPGADAWIAEAVEVDVLERIASRAARGDLLLAGVGPVTTAPLTAAGLAARYPERWRIGALIRLLDEFYGDASRRIATTDGLLEVRASAAVLDGQVMPLTPTGLEILRLLASEPGRVRSREEIAGVLPGNHATPRGVEAAISRLRENSGAPSIVRTVPKRGYSLALA